MPFDRSPARILAPLVFNAIAVTAVGLPAAHALSHPSRPPSRTSR
jgi:hypothetical protein